MFEIVDILTLIWSLYEVYMCQNFTLDQINVYNFLVPIKEKQNKKNRLVWEALQNNLIKVKKSYQKSVRG